MQVRLRHLAASLGDVRDIDVMFCQSQGGPLAPRLADERRQAYARLDALLKLAEPRRLVFDLAEWLEIGDWRYDPATQAVREMPLRQFADAALDRAYRKVRRRIQQYAALSDEQRHELRKDAKKLRYAVEFLRGNYAAPGEMRRRKRFSDALAGLQEDLGAANDRLAAEACLARLGLAGSADAEAMLAQWRLGELVAGAERSGGRLLKVKPFWR